MPDPNPDWPHAPVHRLAGSGVFIVTAGTYLKEHFFRSREQLSAVHDGLLRYAAKYRWQLEAWAVFSNHYHFIGRSPEDVEEGAVSLSRFLSHFHSRCAAWLNRNDGTAGRKVWHNFWETQLTHHRSYLARLKYVHTNAVKHGLVANATDYPWCSAGWFSRAATSAQVKTVMGLPIDQVEVRDGFEPVWDDRIL